MSFNFMAAVTVCNNFEWVSEVAQSCPTLWGPMDCSTPGFPVLHHLPEFAQTHVHWVSMPSNHLILCCPLLLLPSIFPSNRVFSKESVLCIRWPKYWSLSFSISPSNEHSGLTSFRIDWFYLFANFQETLKNHLQHHSSKALILQHSAFFMVQLSHPYMTTWKNSFSSKEQASFNCMAAVTVCCDFGVQENKVSHCFHCLIL